MLEFFLFIIQVFASPDLVFTPSKIKMGSSEALAQLDPRSRLGLLLVGVDLLGQGPGGSPPPNQSRAQTCDTG